MRKRTLFVGLLLAAGLYAQPPGPPLGRGRGPGGGPGMFLGAEVFRPGHVVTGAPFSADVVTTSSQTLADGSHIGQSNTLHVYRDSEGRTRREETLGHLNGLLQQASPRQVVFIQDPVAGATYALDTTNKTATKSVFKGQRPGMGQAGRGARGNFAGRNSANVKTEDLGTQTIGGVVAQGTRVTRTIPAGQIGNDQPLQIVNETWYSPDLQMVILRKSTDPRRGEVVTQVQNLSRSEPASTLFQVPTDFTLREMQRRRPGPPAAPPAQ